MASSRLVPKRVEPICFSIGFLLVPNFSPDFSRGQRVAMSVAVAVGHDVRKFLRRLRTAVIPDRIQQAFPRLKTAGLPRDRVRCAMLCQHGIEKQYRMLFDDGEQAHRYHFDI